MVYMMKFGASVFSFAVVLTALFVSDSAYAIGGRLSPYDFNKMYYLASKGKVGILREAVNRGLNIDAVNVNGDTGLCIAIKRKDHVAYNSFRMSGANPRHGCTYEISQQYREFLQDGQAARTDKIVGNEESLYYNEEERSWWPWILGGAALGGGILAFSGGGSSGSSGGGSSSDDDTIAPIVPNDGLATKITNYKQKINSGGLENNIDRIIQNLYASDYLDKIQLLPNVLANSDYLLSYVSVSDGAYFNNLFGGTLSLSDATIGASVYGEGSKALNNGYIKIDATNGAIGLAASNGGQIINSPEGESDGVNGKIDISFKGNSDKHTVIGMYGDTGAKIVNYGDITGTTVIDNTGSSQAGDTQAGSGSGDIDIFDPEAGTGESGETEGEEENLKNNSGTMLGMVLFDLYTGTNLSGSTVSADNYGNIQLGAGYNSATDVAVSLIGMGSYIDDKFLEGNSNPALAEQMKLNNYGNISLSYQGSYQLAGDALKLGKGGLIGIRADAATEALNRGNIKIDLTSTSMDAGVDVAAGMLSVHGAELTNGNAEAIYDGNGGDTGGTIRIVNEANSGGVSYGMLAAKGEGSQTRVYDWKDPKLSNYGLIDMQTSNGYAMASFAGGDVVNYGVINLGVENGQSRYNNNYGLYAAGEDKTDEVLLQNKGIINVYSEESTAIYNAFAGSVEMINDGTIYISNKATNSKVFGGNFSSAYNNGSIVYKVGNSDSFAIPDSAASTVGINVSVDVAASSVAVSGDDSTTKQLFVNDGEMIVGAQFDKNVDYGGTYGTAAVQVSKQGAAVNNQNIILEMFDRDFSQFNVGMWLDSTATAEAYANNYGNIVVNATNSIGMRNDSNSGAAVTNLGSIYANGLYSYGMAVATEGGVIFNGRYDAPSDSVNSIYVTGDNSTGMFLTNGSGYNYGTIYLQANGATAVFMKGSDVDFVSKGNIYHDAQYDDITYFWVSDGASYMMEYPDGLDVEKFTLGKATDGGNISLSKDSTVYVKGENSYLMTAEGDDSVALNNGTVYASVGAKPIIAYKNASALNSGTIYVQNGNGTALMASGDNTSIQNNTFGTIVVDGGNSLQQLGSVWVNSGIGMYTRSPSTSYNYGTISVKSGVGMYFADRTSEGISQGSNSGSIVVDGSNNLGVYTANTANFSNIGTISVSCSDCDDESGYAYGIYNDGQVGDVVNSGTVNVGNHSIGIVNGTNSGNIKVSGVDSFGMQGGRNSGDINVGNDGVGILNGTNSGEIMISGANAYGMQGGENDGDIYVSNDTSFGMNGGTNNSTISGYEGTGGKNITNEGSIEIVYGTGIYGGGTNNGSITIAYGDGAVVTDGGSFVNRGSITVDSGNGVYIVNGSGSNSSSGTITVTGNGYGVKIDNGTFINGGTISYNSSLGGACSNGEIGGECIDTAKEVSTASSNLVYVGENGSFINSGTVDMVGNDINFDDMKADETGAYVVAKGGTYTADSFKGDVVADSDIVMGGFEDAYVNKNSFIGKNDGLNVSSGSYMFEASTTTKDDVTNVELNRKEFEEIMDDKELATFFETNYGLQNNEKLFDAIKGAGDKSTFDETVEIETGKQFYANLPRENMAVLRGLNEQEQNRILEDGLDGSYFGMDFYRTGKDAQDGLSGYADNVYSPYIGFGEKLNHNWRLGATLRAAYADADYDEASSSRDNKILMAFLPILYQNNGFQFLTMPSIGAGYGTYKRHAISGTYEADTWDFYYGLYNHAEYSIDMKVAELVTEAELNLQGSSMSEAEEDDGFNLQSNNSVSLEAGVGLKLRKRIQLAKERSLMLAIGTKYYHEFLDPYKNLKVGMDGSPVDFGVEAYDEDKNRLKTTAEAIYKDGDIAVAAQISHNAEKESSVEGGVGVRYNF